MEAAGDETPSSLLWEVQVDAVYSGALHWMSPPHRCFQDIWRVVIGLIGHICPHEEMESVGGGSRACVSSRRNPIHAHQTQSENQTKSCMGITAGGFTSKSHQGSGANG